MVRLSIAMALTIATFNTHADQLDLSKLPLSIAGATAPYHQSTGWRFAAGLGLEIEPEYHGSKESASEPDLYLEAAYRAKNWEFQSNLLNNKLFYQKSEHLTLIGWVNHEEGRDIDDASDQSLNGMGNTESAIELGGGFNWHVSNTLNFGLYGQSYLSGKPAKGSVGFATAHYTLLKSANLTIELNADLSFANSEHMQVEFGITPKQATTSKYKEYRLSSGLKSFGIGVAALYRLSPNWSISMNADYEKYSAKVADSPLLKAGSDTELEASATIVYKF
ncbi:hypothetical protein PA25_25360 [Pseudoalteromonas sp. A25]|uniref:MipA/OmpV family protein n=1 Tax=Pseudoalteromonas sp. A25 TaxID=116092 RepID=UPI001260D21C|nr:MipA/OmpV family protein [Pseudoalteromonas sp. A25]BBN82551.1 hypothetical protein PA25_25360 [Pseudoalteromonas sp. A25]